MSPRPSRSLASLKPAPSAVLLEEGDNFIVFTSCQAVVWASDTLPVVLFLSLPWRGTPLLSLVCRILMVLIIAIINIIMIAIVTVNVVITGIIIMKTCFLLLMFSLMLLMI